LKFAFLIFKYFPYGGVQRDMLRIAEDCAKQGHQVTIYTGEWRGDRPEHIDVRVLSGKGWLNHQRHQSLIEAMQVAIQKQAVDMVVGFNRMAGLDVYYAADPCFIARAYQEKSWFYRLGSRFRFFRDCEQAVFSIDSLCHILLLTQRDKAEFQTWYNTPEARLHVLQPNIPDHKFKGKDQHACRAVLRAQFGLPPDAKVVLTVGSAYLRKGVDRVLAGLASLPKNIKRNTWLLAVGEYESNSTFQQDAKKMGISEHCILAGGRADVAELMLGADLLAHPARSELAGLVIIEAMTAGLPVLLTDVCGYASHVQNAGAGLVLKLPFTQTVLNDAMQKMLSTSNTNWAKAGVDYTQAMLRESSASAEADLIIALAKTFELART
jgi:UDP-glucose:(heptosyl)LPS alpha-1,3-glucosyltransferase